MAKSSPFWNRKMKTYFKRMDFDKDGTITRADYETMATRFIAAGHITAQSDQDRLRQALTKVYDEYIKPLGGKSDRTMNEAEFISCLDQLVGDPSLRKAIEGPLPLFFTALDRNNDNFISQDELHSLFELMGLSDAASKETFNAIDTNKDGLISKEEFVAAGTDFFLETKDETKPSKLFWGPLV